MLISVINILLILVTIPSLIANNNVTPSTVIAKLKVACKVESNNYFDKYNNIKMYPLLGQGAFGKVYKISDSRVLKIVTMKKDPKQSVLSFTRRIDALMIEIELMKFFADSKRVYNGLESDISYNPKTHYILKMFGCSYVSLFHGIDLETVIIGIELEKLDLSFEKYVIKGTPLNVIHLLDITKKVIRGLYQMHQYGFAHLDLKPDNIMMKNPFEPVLIDFGLSLQLEKTNTPLSIEKIKTLSRKYGSIQGTPFYMDPYIYNNEYRLTSDSYSLGVMMIIYFRLDFDLNTLKDKDSKRITKALETIITPRSCTQNSTTCIFKKDDIVRAKYFKSLVYWLIRFQPVNRVYLDFTMEKLLEIENEYYKDCRLGITHLSNGECFKDRMEYEAYKIRVMEKYTEEKKRKASQQLL